jgi:hypothetical protein
MLALPCVTMLSMTTQIYNITATAAATAASAISVNPLILVGLIAIALVIVTGLAGRVAILCEDLRYTRLFGRNQ